MAAVESGRIDSEAARFRVDVPLPFGRYQSADKIVDGAMTMARLVDSYWKAKRVPSKASRELKEISRVMRNKWVSEGTKRDAISGIMGLSSTQFDLKTRIALRVGSFFS